MCIVLSTLLFFFKRLHVRRYILKLHAGKLLKKLQYMSKLLLHFPSKFHLQIISLPVQQRKN